MHSNAKYRVEGKRLIVEVSGTFDPDEAVRRFEHITAACRSQQLTQVLVDCRELEGLWLATPEIIYVSRIAAIHESYRKDGGKPFRIAYVASDAYFASDTHRGGFNPGAEVANQSGMDLYTTEDFDAALAWLDT